MTRAEQLFGQAAPVAFEPVRRFPCPAYQMEPWLPPADHAELKRRAAALGVTPREFALQAVRFAMALQKGN
jgi:hypothetical protein